jgi:putative spermidine/putrescine transport system permease protein
MAVYAGKAEKGFFYIGVMLPMWASYIVKAYSWTVILAKGGIVYWVLSKLGLVGILESLLSLPYVGGSTLSTSHVGRFIVFTYIWLPFMILPIQAAIERVPQNLMQASQDLGANVSQSFRYVLLPLAFPGIVAGSIFTFSLTLGDYIIPTLIGPAGLFIGNFVYVQQGAAGNIPLAAAFTVVPIVLIALYLMLAKRFGAFDAL